MAVKKRILVFASILILFCSVFPMSHNTYAVETYAAANRFLFAIDDSNNYPHTAHFTDPKRYDEDTNYTALWGQQINTYPSRAPTGSYVTIRGRMNLTVGNTTYYQNVLQQPYLRDPQAPLTVVCGWGNVQLITDAAFVQHNSGNWEGQRKGVYTKTAYWDLDFTWTGHFNGSYTGVPSGSLMSCTVRSSERSDPYASNQTISAGNLPWSNPFVYATNNSYDSYLSVETNDESNQDAIVQINASIEQQTRLMREQYDRENQAIDNIENQSVNDIPNSDDQKTTSLIGFLSGFLSALTNNVGAESCSIRIQTNSLPNNYSYNQLVNPCIGREQFSAAGGDIFFDVFLPIIAIMFYLPFAIFVLRLIYKEIRSFTG